MTFLLTHWWTLTGLTLAAVLVGVSLAGLTGLADAKFGVDTDARPGSLSSVRRDDGTLAREHVGADSFWDGAA